jgi:hypothetical protein
VLAARGSRRHETDETRTTRLAPVVRGSLSLSPEVTYQPSGCLARKGGFCISCSNYLEFKSRLANRIFLSSASPDWY